MPNRSPLFTWARNTPLVRFTGTGTRSYGVFRVGQGTDRKFLFLETHYHHPFATPDTTSGITIHITRNLNKNPPAGTYNELAIFSMMGTGTIPANTSSYAIDICILRNLPSYFLYTVIGFQSHTHNLGRVVSTYYSTSTNAASTTAAKFEVAVGNPMWPNAYLYVEASSMLVNGRNYFTRCIYTSTGVENATNTNGRFSTQTAWHEMCLQSLIVSNGASPFSSTTPAFLTGKCPPTVSAVMNTFLPSTFSVSTSAGTNDVLNAYAISGTGSGSYSYTGPKGKLHNIDLTMQTFSQYFK